MRNGFRSLAHALLWLRREDSSGCGLRKVREAADWANQLARSFQVLYDNL